VAEGVQAMYRRSIWMRFLLGYRSSGLLVLWGTLLCSGLGPAFGQTTSGREFSQLDLPKQAVVSAAVVTEAGTEFFRVGEAEADEHTLFEIGSVTKVFTALATAQLTLADPALPATTVGGMIEGGVSDDLKQRTVLELLTHTSGVERLPPSFGMLYLIWHRQDPYRSYDEKALRKDLGRTSIASKRGQFLYSNYGYMILGLLLEGLADQSYEQIIKTGILDPLGMSSSFVHYTPENADACIQGFGETGTKVGIWRHHSSAPAGAIKSNAHDLAIFMRAFLYLGENSLGQAMAKSLQVETPVSGRRSLAFGWQVSRYKNKVIYWHNGATGGYRAFVGMIPEEKRAVVLLCNYAGVAGLDRFGFNLLTEAGEAL